MGEGGPIQLIIQGNSSQENSGRGVGQVGRGGGGGGAEREVKEREDAADGCVFVKTLGEALLKSRPGAQVLVESGYHALGGGGGGGWRARI